MANADSEFAECKLGAMLPRFDPWPRQQGRSGQRPFALPDSSIIGALASAASERLHAAGYGNVTVRHGDGYRGWPEYAPYDGIIVTAAAPHIPPPLVEQLKPGARLVIPVGLPGEVQQLMLVEKGADGAVSSRCILLVAFVPQTRSKL